MSFAFAVRLRPARPLALVLTLAALGCGNDTIQNGADTGGGAGDVDTVIVACTQVADCPKPTDVCLIATCSAAGACGTAPAADGLACDDGDACSPSSACAAGVCTGASACCQKDSDCAGQEDGDLCNGTLFCDTSLDAPACKPKPNSTISCDDSLDHTCSVNRCDPKTGVCAPTPEPDGKACDDGSACTPVDACKGGSCGGVSTCACESDGDCAASDDGDPCNGKLFCDLGSHTCVVNPATIITCQTDGNGPCHAWQCQRAAAPALLAPSPTAAPATSMARAARSTPASRRSASPAWWTPSAPARPPPIARPSRTATPATASSSAIRRPRPAC